MKNQIEKYEKCNFPTFIDYSAFFYTKTPPSYVGNPLDDQGTIFITTGNYSFHLSSIFQVFINKYHRISPNAFLSKRFRVFHGSISI